MLSGLVLHTVTPSQRILIPLGGGVFFYTHLYISLKLYSFGNKCNSNLTLWRKESIDPGDLVTSGWGGAVSSKQQGKCGINIPEYPGGRGCSGRGSIHAFTWVSASAC